MKIVRLLLSVTLLFMGNVNAQNEYPSNGELEKTRIVNKKKFRVLYEEVQIDASIDAVWNEIAGNFGKGESIAASMNESRGLTGDLITGLGAERYLNINFQGSTIEVKERIIDFKDCGDQREYTYDVYESKGTPLRIKTYNSWYVRKGEDGNTYLGSAFIFRPNLGFLTGLIGKKLAQSGSIRTGLLSVKHYLETGEKKVAADKLDKLYPL